jgi:hypothetical protein
MQKNYASAQEKSNFPNRNFDIYNSINVLNTPASSS